MRRRAPMAAALLLALAGAACRSNEAVELPKPVPEAKPGGTIVVGTAAPQSIEPATVSSFDAAGSRVVETMCDRLLEFDPVTGDPKPAIAESWQVSDGGQRITVKLRKGVRFGDGTELTSEDVSYSLTRVVLPETASPVADLLRPIDGFDELRGEKAGNAEDRTELKGVKVIDNFSLEITLKERQADFVRMLGHPATTPVSKRATEKDLGRAATEPVCAGPYKLAEPWEPGKPALRLVRTQGYYAQNTAFTRGGAGWADVIEFRVQPDRAASFAAWQAGAVDVSRVPSSALAQAKTLGENYVQAPGPTLEYIGLPVTQEPFERRAVRVALSQALDRRAIVETVYGGGREPATGLLPPTVGRELYRKDACGDRAPVGGDVAAARKTLADAGVDLNGKAVKIYFNDEFANRALVQAVGAQWQAAFGIVPQPVSMGWEQYLDTASRQPGLDGAFRMGWAAQYPSADAYLFPLLDSASIGRDNLTRFSNREFDRSLEREARRAADDAELRDTYQRLEDTACSQMPLIPVAYGAVDSVVRAAKLGAARGVYTEAASGELALRELFVK